MKSDEVYETWKKSRSEIEVGSGLTDEVMRRVRRYESGRRRPLIDAHELIERISRHRPARAAVIAAAALTGAARIWLVVYAFFGC
ncbi:MAG: hypothetical protein JSU94_13975 [Phycisphaerales bacterium]|nr:MAG: hypothetical protein JSU94_13975 [Phycisphaerales bacterium]